MLLQNADKSHEAYVLQDGNDLFVSKDNNYIRFDEQHHQNSKRFIFVGVKSLRFYFICKMTALSNYIPISTHNSCLPCVTDKTASMSSTSNYISNTVLLTKRLLWTLLFPTVDARHEDNLAHVTKIELRL